MTRWIDGIRQPEPNWYEVEIDNIQDQLKSNTLEIANLAKEVHGLASALLELVNLLPNWATQVSRQTAETVVTASLGGYRIDN